MTTKPNVAELGTLEPAAVWQFFAGIAATPRPSKREEKIRSHLRDLANKHNLKLHEDKVGNIVIEAPATPGYENVPITVLQGHVDMVCEKNSDVDHDFDNDPIAMQIIEDPQGGGLVIRAAGTTLGADNGIGIAMALAAAVDPEVVHGPLELLCTADEEAGMTGAKALTPDSFRGKRLLNLDSEEDDQLYIGCAGGCDTNLTWNLSTAAPAAGSEFVRVTVSGLRGGHSGGDIHENRGNAIKLLVRMLQSANVDRLQIASITGGSLRNAIPREADALVSGPTGVVAALRSAGEQVQADAQGESSEPNVNIEVANAEPADVSALLSVDDSQRLLSALAALPHGVLGMHPAVPGLVETSNNVAKVTSVVDGSAGRMQVKVETLARSSSESLLHVALDQIAAVGRLAGATVETANEYPGWEPNLDSPILATCRRVYEELFGEAPEVAAIHAGLECGIIGKQVGGMDTVSFGPRIEGAHSPDEQVWVASVQKSWKYLGAVLAELAKG